MNEHSRSIDLRHHFIRQDYLEHSMRIGGVSSKDNTSDILTKFLQPDLHHTHTNPLFPPRPKPTSRPRSTPEITPTEITEAPHQPTVNTTKATTNTHLRNMVTHARSPRVHRRRRRNRPPENPPQPPGSPPPCP